jgi:hypothetical protein
MIRRGTSALLLTASLFATREAHADDDFEEIVAVVTIVGVVGATDIGFTVHDAVLFAQGRQPSQSVAIAETAIAGPQAIFGHVGLAALAHDRGDDEFKLVLTAPAMVVSALTTHGIWSLARPDEAPNVLFGASTIIGINSLWTTLSVSNAFDGHMPPGPTGALKIATTAPAAAWSIAEAVRGESFQPGWIALSAWSGAVLLHGVVEVVWGEEGTEVARAPGRALGIEDLSVAPMSLDQGSAMVMSGRF